MERTAVQSNQAGSPNIKFQFQPATINLDHQYCVCVMNFYELEMQHSFVFYIFFLWNNNCPTSKKNLLTFIHGFYWKDEEDDLFYSVLFWSVPDLGCQVSEQSRLLNPVRVEGVRAKLQHTQWLGILQEDLVDWLFTEDKRRNNRGSTRLSVIFSITAAEEAKFWKKKHTKNIFYIRYAT